jgi:hypothetical protein
VGESAVLHAWQSGDTASLSVLLAENATFRSPVADYAGRANASHVMKLIGGVLNEIRPTTEWGADRDTVSAFTARVQGEEVQGMLSEERDDSGALLRVTLFIRPYRTLRTAIGLMGELLAGSLLPDGER